MWTAIMSKEVREGRWKWITFASILLGTAILAQVMYTTLTGFSDQLGGTTPLTAQLQRQLADPLLYHWGNWYAKNLFQMTAIFSALMGMSAIAGEVSRGTAPYLFARPLDRTAILAAKVLAGYGTIALVMILTTVLVPIVARMGGMDLPSRFLSGLPMALIGALVLYLIAVTASALLDDPVKAGAAAGLAMALLSVPGFFRDWAQFSIFRQMSGLAVLSGEPYPLVPALILLGGAAGLFAVAAGVLRRKEFTR